MAANTELDMIPWVEKYRPKTLDEVHSQLFVIRTLKKFVSKRSFPHLIFTGPAGTGKTSAAVALINDLLGQDYPSDLVMEMNASDSVRMETIREEIKGFTTQSGLSSMGQFKFLLLDEADNIPTASQQALRRIVEMSPPNVKFIFMCNYANRLIDPIISRCAIFRFTPLDKNAVKARLLKILEKENQKVSDDVLETLFEISAGDMRKAVNLLQMGLSHDPDSELTSEILYDISGYVLPDTVKEIITYIKQHQFVKAKIKLNQIPNLSPREFLSQIRKGMDIFSYEYPTREHLIDVIAEFDFRLTLGSDPMLQIEGMIAEIIRLIS